MVDVANKWYLKIAANRGLNEIGEKTSSTEETRHNEVHRQLGFHTQPLRCLVPVCNINNLLDYYPGH